MKKKILIIDDQKLICDMIERWLSRQDYEIFKAHDSKTGFELAISEKPDLFIIDILIPGINGIELCQKIRQETPLKMRPIILMSAIYKDYTLIHQIRNVSDAFIEKPFKEQDLIDKVNQFLKKEMEGKKETDWHHEWENKFEGAFTKAEENSKPPVEIIFQKDKPIEPIKKVKQQFPDEEKPLNITYEQNGPRFDINEEKRKSASESEESIEEPFSLGDDNDLFDLEKDISEKLDQKKTKKEESKEGQRSPSSKDMENNSFPIDLEELSGREELFELGDDINNDEQGELLIPPLPDEHPSKKVPVQERKNSPPVSKPKNGEKDKKGFKSDRDVLAELDDILNTTKKKK